MDDRTIFRKRRRRPWRRVLALVLVAVISLLVASALVGSGTGGAHRGAVRSAGKAVSRPHRRPRSRQEPAPVRPPQFLVVSFDGSGGTQLWPYWRAVARAAHAHFTFFVSGVYLLSESKRDLYHPPRNPVGASAIGFLQPRGRVSAATRVRMTLLQISRAYREGNEIGTHFNGHFCAPLPGSVGTWTAADWRSELDQFQHLLFDASANNGIRPAVRLPFGPGEVAGERTPCLQGDMRELLPALASRGFLYDASQISPLGAWPYRELGVWEVPLELIPFVGHTYRVVSMDYNFFYNQAIAGVSPGESERQTFASLWNAFLVSYQGNRAPLSFANHFETWNGWAYDHALARVVLRACRLPEVRCVSFRELVRWLDAQPQARLRRYESGRFPRLRPR